MIRRDRVIILGVIFFILTFILIIRLFYIQVLLHGYFVSESEKKNVNIDIVNTVRGRILDRNGFVLAEDVIKFDLGVIPLELDEKKEESLKNLCQVTGLRLKILEDELKKIESHIEESVAEFTGKRKKSALKKQRSFIYKLDRIVKDIPKQLAKEISVNEDKYGGFVILTSVKRNYPVKGMDGHIVGYVSLLSGEKDKNSKNEYERLRDAGYFLKEFERPGENGEMELTISDEQYNEFLKRGVFVTDVMGRDGIEKFYQETLKGKRGAVMYQRKKGSTTIEELKIIEAQNGKDIHLTIDMEIQKKVEALMRPAVKAGVFILMDVYNGEILSMVSIPTYEVNAIVEGDKERLSEIFKTDNLYGSKLINRAVNGIYPPGSIFKIITAITALEEGLVKPDRKFFCDGYFNRDWQYLKCWKYEAGGHGDMDMHSGFKNSCNVYFYKLGEAIHKNSKGDKLYEWTKKFGFGYVSKIDLPNEQVGIIPDNVWRRRNNIYTWKLQDTLKTSIGQGEIAVTPLQIIRMISAVANGGYLVQPHLRKIDSEGLRSQSIGVSKKTIELIQEYLKAVVEEQGGTGYGSGLREYKVAGKTGTAETDRKFRGLPLPDHAWFAGYFPYDNPKYSCVLIVEYGGKGSEAAAPLLKTILDNIADKIKMEKTK